MQGGDLVQSCLIWIVWKHSIFRKQLSMKIHLLTDRTKTYKPNCMNSCELATNLPITRWRFCTHWYDVNVNSTKTLLLFFFLEMYKCTNFLRNLPKPSHKLSWKCVGNVNSKNESDSTFHWKLAYWYMAYWKNNTSFNFLFHFPIHYPSILGIQFIQISRQNVKQIAMRLCR